MIKFLRKKKYYYGFGTGLGVWSNERGKQTQTNQPLFGKIYAQVSSYFPSVSYRFLYKCKQFYPCDHTCRALRMGLTVSHLDPRMSRMTVKPFSRTSSLAKTKGGVIFHKILGNVHIF